MGHSYLDLDNPYMIAILIGVCITLVLLIWRIAKCCNRSKNVAPVIIPAPKHSDEGGCNNVVYHPTVVQYPNGYGQNTSGIPQYSTGIPQYATGIPQYPTGVGQYPNGFAQYPNAAHQSVQYQTPSAPYY